jgi:hypothetical protein
VIYLALTAFVVYQALPSQRANPALRRIGYLFAASSVANSVWIFMWHYELFALSLVVMLSLLAMLIAIYVRLDVGVAPVPAAVRRLVHLPFSIYLGWITVATAANATDVLYLTGWDGWGIPAQTWAVLLLVVASLIASAVVFTRRDLAYAAVIVWAFIGIMVKQWEAQPVAIAAAVLAAVVAGVWLFSMVGRRGSPRLQASAA